MLAHPDVGPTLAALGFAHAAFERVPGAVRIGRGGLGLAEEIAQVEEMLLRGAALRQVGPLPFHMNSCGVMAED
jgi:hypothetical protein